MNRLEFLQKLEKALINVPAEEKANAIQYYTEYFDDAGPEHEQDILKHLGSPETIAEEIIKNSVSENSEKKHEPPFAEKVSQTQNKTFEPELTLAPTPDKYWEKAANTQNSQTSSTAQASEQYSKKPIIAIIAIVAAFFIFGNILLPIVIAALCILFMPFILSIAFGVSFVATLIFALFGLGVNPPAILIMLGVAIMFLSFTLLFAFLGVQLCKKFYPLIIKGIKKLFTGIKKAFS